MALKTYIEIVNDIQVRLRAPTSPSVGSGDSYAGLLGRLVNEAKREVEEAWRWTHLRQCFPITTVASDKLYSLTGFGQRYRISQVLNDTRNLEIRPVANAFIERRLNFETDPTGTPRYYRIFTQDATGDPQIEFYPTPTGVETINVYATVAQDNLVADDDELLVPYWPVFLKALELAISERGEDGGAVFDEVSQQANEALNEAIAQDNMNVARGWHSDWHVE